MAEIREILYRSQKGESNRATARSLGISRTSVGKYLQMAQKYGFSSRSSISELNDIALQVADEIYQEKGRKSSNMEHLKSHHELIGGYLLERNMTHTQIQRKLLELHEVDINIRALNRYIQRQFAPLSKATIHINTIAGEEAQVDYGYVGLMDGADNKLHKTYVFVMTLSHSRYRYVEFVQSQNQTTWCQCHINAFSFFGAVPVRVLLDNLKAGVVKPDIYDPTLNPVYEELSRFYNFIADPAKVRQPQHKGKVERSVLIVKQQLIAGCHYKNIEHANELAQDWCLTKISQRICTTTGRTPFDLFVSEDKPSMLALPTAAFDMPQWTNGIVHQDHHVTIDGNFYSMPTNYIGKKVAIRIGLRIIDFYCAHRLIKSHIRNFGKGQWITDENDYHLAAQKYLNQQPAACIEEAKELGESIHYVILAILANQSNTNLRKAQAVLRLADKYSAKRLNDACFRAATFDNYNYKAIAKILDKKLDDKNSSSYSTRILDVSASAYIRAASDYSSSMEVNYG